MNKITLGFFQAKSKTTIKGLLLLFALFLMNTQSGWAQITESFESGLRTSGYAGNGTNTGNLTLTSGAWVFVNSGLRNSTNKSGGLYSCQMQSGTGNSATLPSLNTCGTITFYFKGGTPTLNKTVGSTTTSVTLSTTGTTLNTFTQYTATINDASSAITLKISNSATTSYLDDVVTTIYTASSASPTLIPDATSNTVDNLIDITFTDDSTWRSAVTAVKIGTTILTSGTDYDLTAGNLQLKPSGLNALLTTSGSKSVVIEATGYTNATVTQAINAGVPTTNSTAAISAALAQNTTRTITCTAKDQYNNLVSGYTFAYDVTITNNSSTTAESYTIDGSPFTTTSTTGNPVVATTNASGVATFDAVLPSTIDSSDGISIQVQLNNDSTNIGSAFSFTQLASQAITFNAVTPVTYGDATFGLTATASSLLPVSYESSNTAVATISGSIVTIVGAGSTNITASQSGNGSYNAAANEIQSLTVNAKGLTLPDAAAASRVYNTLLTTDITGTLTGIINADDVTLVGALKGTFADANVANGIGVNSACTLAGTKAGNYILTQPIGLTANITQASQTITFGALANKTAGAANFTLSATASSTLAVTYASSNEAVATVSGNTVTIVGVGSTNITASQIGDGNYTAATDVVQSLTVTAAPLIAWQFGSPASLGNEVTYNATTNDTNLNTVVLSRGTGIAATGLGRAFSANTWANLGTKTSAISDNEYFEFAVTVKPGYKLNLTALDATIRRSGASSPNAYIWSYSTDGTNFTEIGTDISYTGTTEGVSQPQIDLSAISALQNVENTTSLTFRLYAWGGTSTTSTFAFGRYGAGVTTNSLSISGTITNVPTTTWTTSWSNGTPDATKEAIIDGTYNTNVGGVQGPFTAKKLTVTSLGSLTINTGTNVTVQNEVINSGSLVVENNANLIQVNNIANTGAITVNRNSSLLKRLDYTLWSSPVSGTQTLAGFSPLTSQSPSRFYTFDTTYNTGGVNGAYAFIASPTTTTFAEGAGYLIRMPNTADAVTATAYAGQFTGEPNNGDIPVSLIDGAAAGLRFNLVGNPYPSTISMQKFVFDNNTANIENTLWFWRKTNGAGTAYCTWQAGALVTDPGTFVTNGNAQSVNPMGIIQTAQGFFVEAKSGATSLTFKNSQRVGNNGNQYFKTKQAAEASKIWLNATNVAGDFSQMAVTYFDKATVGLDAFDGKYINDSAFALTSYVDNGEYTIQGRPAFDVSDVVALNFKTNSAGDYTIAIDHSEGVFASGQDIYLVDNTNGTETNLKTSSYNFTAAAGTDNTRFSLKYQKTLKVDAPAFDDNSISVYNNNGTLYVNSKSVAISNIKVFDVQGRLLAEQKNVKSTTSTINNLRANHQVLIVKITSADNKEITKKLLN